jgi:hypothetical protein
VHPELKFLAATMEAPEPYSVAVFRQRPVRVGSVRQALRKFEGRSHGAVVAVGLDFTVEAVELAESRGAHVLRRYNFGWTESSYDQIHASIASRKKFPANAT